MNPLTDPKPDHLRLLAHDEEDLPVVSALLQDAAVRLDDVHYDRRRRRLTLLANRYRWEAGQRSRVRTLLAINHVTAARRRCWPGDPDAVLGLLALRHEAGVLTLVFSGGAEAAVDVECVDLLMEDVSGPWGTWRTPAHERPGETA